jgi:geranylgeranyl diphosphate synthase type II
MHTEQDIQKVIKQAFEAISWEVKPLGLYKPIEYVLGLGGKRIRPSLVLYATNMFSENIDAAINPAIGLEIFHNFTLLHDDIMDRAPVRRNKPTVHIKWNDNAAILSGDAMLIKAYQYLADVPSEKLSDCLKVFSQTALEVCEGQQYDMDFEVRDDVSEFEYLQMIRLKTAVLLGACLKIGALIGGANKMDAQCLYDFGIHIGLAFQLKDDLLDVYGNPDTFGKQIGGDILCNKKTFLLINALNEANEKDKGALLNWISKTDFEPNEKIKAVTKIYNNSGVKILCESKMEVYYQTALTYLEKVQVPEDKKAILRSLANGLMSREV